MRTMRKLLLILVATPLIAGPAMWKLNQLCQLSQDSCDAWGMLHFVLSDRLALAGTALILMALLTVLWAVIRDPLDSDEDDEEGISEEKKVNLNATVVMLVVFVAYLGASIALLMRTSLDHVEQNPGSVSIFVWKVMGPIYGAGFVYPLLWSVNDYFVKPASNILLGVLFLTTVGAIYMAQKSIVLGF